MTTPQQRIKDLLAKPVTGFHEAAFKLSGGRVGGTLLGMPVLLLTTKGRRSGNLRATPLTYFEFDGNVVLVASWGGDDRDPQWFKNLVAHPIVTIDRGKGAEEMVARTAAADEKAVWWPIITTKYRGYADYQKATTRRIPLVVLTATS